MGFNYENSLDFLGMMKITSTTLSPIAFFFSVFFVFLLFLFSYNAQLENLYGNAQIIME
jgi:hypothetical protein